MVTLFGDTELEEWFKASVWAKDRYSGYLPSDEFGKGRLTGEVNDIFEIIARPRVQVLLDIDEEMGLEVDLFFPFRISAGFPLDLTFPSRPDILTV